MLTVIVGVIVGITAWRLAWNIVWRIQFHIHDRHSETLAKRIGSVLNWLST